jgi:predicted AlkP superfamily pyrophosphatase or phosphodiesterase
MRLHAPRIDLFLVVCLAGLLNCSHKEDKVQNKAKLYLLIVVDQLRGDELYKHQDLWQHGFKRLTQEGRWYDNAKHGHARTETAAGHATIATGLHPKWHGIINKKMFLPKENKAISICDWGTTPCTPDALLEPTIGDRLKAHNPQSKVLSLAQKDRAAMLMGGRRADVVAWMSHDNPTLEGRTAGTPGVPAWLESAYKTMISPEKMPKTWNLGNIPTAYKQIADNRPDEVDIGMGITFPHKLPDIEKDAAPPWAWFYTPHSDEVLLELGLLAAQKLNLGKDHIPDLMMISFSVVDTVGHAFGPGSLERISTLMALDKTLGILINKLEKQSGGQLVVGLSADHGVAPLPAIARQNGFDSGRIDPNELHEIMETALEKNFGQGPHVQAIVEPYVFLYPKAGRYMAKAIQQAAKALSAHPHIFKAWPTYLLENMQQDELTKLMLENSHPLRSGHIIFAPQPYYSMSHRHRKSAGSNHGTPWDYDRHVPIILWGQGIQTKRLNTPVQVIDLTRTLADRLGLTVDVRGGKPLP